MPSVHSQPAPKSVGPKSLRVPSQGMVPLVAQHRAQAGKGEARRLRAAGQVPAVAYGKGLPSTLLSVSPKDILAILKSERGKNCVIEMQVKGAPGESVAALSGPSLLMMIREYTYHPVHRLLEHVDFVQVKLDEEVDVDVPLIPLGKAAGVTAGGIVRQVYRTVPVRCLPDRIPLKLEIDISHLQLGEHVATQDLKLAQGARVLLPAEQTLIAIVTPEKEKEEVPVEAAPGAVAGAPGAAAPAGAAPAGAGAAPEGGKDAKGAAPAAAAKDAKKK
jgi:large subunit ribosomal protein L25